MINNVNFVLDLKGRGTYSDIIIIAKMAVFNVAGYLIEERRRCSVITASPRGQIPNKFSTSWLAGLKMHPTILLRSGIELITSRLHSFIVAKVSHALTHSTMEAVLHVPYVHNGNARWIRCKMLFLYLIAIICY